MLKSISLVSIASIAGVALATLQPHLHTAICGV